MTNKKLKISTVLIILVLLSVIAIASTTVITSTGFSQFFSGINMNNNAIDNVTTINTINFTGFYNNYVSTNSSLNSEIALQLANNNTQAGLITAVDGRVTSVNGSLATTSALSLTANTTANTGLALATTANNTANALVVSNTTNDLRLDANTYWNAKTPANGLVSYYSFEGNAKDSIGTNDGVVVGAVSTTSGAMGKAYTYNGSASDYTNLSQTLNFSSPFTITMWVYPTSSGVEKIFIGPITGTTYLLAMQTTQVLRAFNGTAWNSLTTTAVVSNQYNHITFIGNGTHITACINGVCSGTFASIPPIALFNIYLGRGYSAGSHFAGSMDELMIFNRALSNSEVKNLYLSYNPQYTDARADTLNATLVSNTATISALQTNNATANTNIATLSNQYKSSIYRRFGLPANGFISYFDFDNNANDQIGSSIGTIVSATQTSTGLMGNAYSYDGTLGYISTPTISGLNNNTMSFSFWVYMNGTDTGSAVFSGANNSISAYRVSVASTRTDFWCGTADVKYTTSGLALNDSTWHHFVFVRNGVNAITYKDGVVFGAGYTSCVAQPPTNFNVLNIIGAGSTTGVNNFKGIIDELMIFNRSLSATDVKRLYYQYNPSNLTIS